ncbi:MAG: apolipoprotein N-acyltransferase [Acidobacteria bacterium]|nr:apolipoprotein N-acyltransferase [Acidobacteriota bacterium]
MNFALALLSGALLVLIHPRFDLAWLAPFAVTPLVIALGREWRPKYRFLLGYAAGIVFWAGICYWIQFVMAYHGRLGNLGGAAAFVLFCILKAIHLGVFGLLAGIVVQRAYALFAVPALWVAVERIPGLFGLMGFMWLPLGNAGIDMSVPMRLAPLTGVYGLSFVFAAMGTAFALILLRRPRLEIAPVAVLLCLFLLPPLPAPQPGAEVAVSMQPGIRDRPDRQWTQPEAADLQRALELHTLQAAVMPGQQKPQLILWPEVPAPIYYYDDPPLRDRLAQMARLTGAHLLIGTVAYNQRGAPLNAALMIAPSGDVAGRYDKMFLVPFGEYIPFPFRGIVQRITNEVGDFVPGERVVTFRLNGDKVGPFICYESAFPHLVRRFVNQGATVLANLSNDGYFGGSAAREQHLELVRMRAAENRRWVLRSTNDGITAAIDPAGRVVQTFPELRRLSGRLPYSHIRESTLYTRWGDWFVWLCVAASLAALLWSQVPHWSRPPGPPRSRL